MWLTIAGYDSAEYANSLGCSFDAPDLTIRIAPREHRLERILGPEEPMTHTLDLYFPGGQAVHEPLVIDVPFRRMRRMPSRLITPKTRSQHRLLWARSPGCGSLSARRRRGTISREPPPPRARREYGGGNAKKVTKPTALTYP